MITPREFYYEARHKGLEHQSAVSHFSKIIYITISGSLGNCNLKPQSSLCPSTKNTKYLRTYSIYTNAKFEVNNLALHDGPNLVTDSAQGSSFQQIAIISLTI